MIKAVNMKNYTFGNTGCMTCKGFGMLDTETNMFVGWSAKYPITQNTKRLAEKYILEGWAELFPKRVAIYSVK